MADTIRDLFASNIDRRIEEVIKVDQTDEDVIQEEIEEYVVTGALKRHYTDVLDRYLETPNKPHEGTSVWISGFFGSGKSSFAKILGLALENRPIGGSTASELFAQRTGDNRIDVLLKGINERIPTHAVIFDVSTDRGIRSGEQRLTEITYRLFLKSLGYASDLDLAELEITLETEGRLDDFKATYKGIFNRDWDTEKGKVAIALGQASRVMHELEPDTYNEADSWVKSAQGRADVSPNFLAERCKELLDRHKPGQALAIVIDEVGQFVARDVQKMLDLQGISQAIGRVGKGRMWMVVTSQEKLSQLVGGIDDRRVELARLQDRFPLRVDLEQSDISEVTSRRVLSKNAEAQKQLRKLFEDHRGRLTQNTKLSADITLPELDAQSFVDIYPLLPYQVDFIIKVVSGLRTQGGTSRHVGGANRTIIKLAQQLLINPRVKLAEDPIGQLARIDQIYDLVEENIDSEVRTKVAAIGSEVPHPLAQPVAKAICLLQFVQSIHRTAENIAATLHPSVGGDSQLAEVKEALQKLEKSGKIRLGDDGYRIPTPAEDDWEDQRRKLIPKPGEVNRLHAETIEQLWQPQPKHSFHGVKEFKAGLHLNNKQVLAGDITVQMITATVGADFDSASAEARTRSQSERKSLFWVVPLDDPIDRETVELFRSNDMLERKGRSAQTKAESALVAEEKRRRQRHQGELKRLMKAACSAGYVCFQGNDRSPGEHSGDVGQLASRLIGDVLPDVYDRFAEAAAKVQKQDIEALLTADNLRGLTTVFSKLNLVKDENGQPAFNLDENPLSEVVARIENQYNYGEAPSGRALADYFGSEPFGWEFDMVRLLSLSLLRAGVVEITHKSEPITSAQTLRAKEVFTNNNLFRQATFRPRGGPPPGELIKAAENFKKVFGRELPELEQSSAAANIRAELEAREAEVDRTHDSLIQFGLPGTDLLAEAVNAMRAIRTGSEGNAITTFNGSHANLSEAIKRAAEIDQNLTPPAVEDLRRARKALGEHWPFLNGESDIEDELTAAAEKLADTLHRETFYRELPEIDQLAAEISNAYQQKYEEALKRRVSTYETALERLQATPGWGNLDPDQHALVAEPLKPYADPNPQQPMSIPQLRSDTDACSSRLKRAVDQVVQATTTKPIAQVSASSYFDGGIETPEQLEAALDGLRDECLREIGAGKKVVIR